VANEELERLDRQGIGAWERQDADAFVSLFADNFTWRDWGLPEPMKDKEAAKGYFNAWMVAFPDFRIKSITRVIGDDSVAAEIEFNGHNTGPLIVGDKEIPPTNKYVVGRGVYFARYEGGKIVAFSSHPDVAGMMMQMGLMPSM
jgi:predicted ester cyclase